MTRIHRFYNKFLHKCATVNIVDEPIELPSTKQLSQPGTYPAGEEIHNPSSYHPEDSQRKIARGDSSIVALIPTQEVANKIADLYPELDINPDDLHVTLAYFESKLNAEQADKVKDILDTLCGEHSALNCTIQGLGVFNGDEPSERPVYLSVDAIGMAELHTSIVDALSQNDIDVSTKHDFTPHMTLAYMDPGEFDFNTGSPEMEWVSSSLILMDGNERTEFKLGDDNKKAQFGVSLIDLTNPSRSTHFEGLDSGTLANENTSEDGDLKLGTVEAPCSDGHGAISVNADDAHKPKKCAGLYGHWIGPDGEIIDVEYMSHADVMINYIRSLGETPPNNVYGWAFSKGFIREVSGDHIEVASPINDMQLGALRNIGGLDGYLVEVMNKTTQKCVDEFRVNIGENIGRIRDRINKSLASPPPVIACMASDRIIWKHMYSIKDRSNTMTITAHVKMSDLFGSDDFDDLDMSMLDTTGQSMGAIVDQYGTVYETVSEASRVLNISSTLIRDMLKGKRYDAGGYKFKYVDQDSKEAVALPDNNIDENKYEDDSFRSDQSIPR